MRWVVRGERWSCLEVEKRKEGKNEDEDEKREIERGSEAVRQ